MTRIFLLIVVAFSLTNCKNKKEEHSCSDDNCYGKHDIYLSNTYKNYVIKKDTVFTYVNTVNDTIKVKFRKTYTEIYNQKFTCYCVEKSTDITGEYHKGIYIFENKNLAVQYSATIVYPNRTTFGIIISDTNYIVNNISNPNTITYYFRVGNIAEKQNNFDSLNVNGKYYYNVINTYDDINANTNISDCYYSRNFGIISFKYNTFVYNIVS